MSQRGVQLLESDSPQARAAFTNAHAPSFVEGM